MATSGTTAFTLDLGDIMEEAYDLCGSELRSGYDYRGAKRALNLIFLEWQNKGLNLWTVQEGTQALTGGDGSYTLSGDVLDIIEAFVRTNSGSVDSQFDQTLTTVIKHNNIYVEQVQGVLYRNKFPGAPPVCKAFVKLINKQML